MLQERVTLSLYPWIGAPEGPPFARETQNAATRRMHNCILSSLCTFLRLRRSSCVGVGCGGGASLSGAQASQLVCKGLAAGLVGNPPPNSAPVPQCACIKEG